MWSSNVFTRERLEVKQKLLSLVRALEPTLEGLQLDLQRFASDEYPSLRNSKKVDALWVYYWRNENDRAVLEGAVDLEKTLAATLADPTPMTRHAFLCFRLAQDGLEVAFRLHRDAWVDQRNLRNKLQSDEKETTLLELVRALGEPATIDIGDSQELSVTELDGERLRSIVESHAQGDASAAFLRIGLRLSPKATQEHNNDLVEYLAPRLEGIARLYQFIAWTKDNDFVSNDEEFLQRSAERGARREELAAHEAEHQAATKAKRKEGEAARRELEELFRREAVARSAAPRRPLRKPAESSTSAPKQSPSNTPAKTKGTAPSTKPAAVKAHPKAATKPPKPQPLPTEPQPVTIGHQARVTQGPFSGQIGIVQEIDARGNARVMVGLLATRVAVEDLVGLGPQIARD